MEKKRIDWDLVFLTKVDTNKIKKLLTPIDNGDGSIDNADLELLDKNLNLFYFQIDSIILQIKFVDFIRDYIVILRKKIREQEQRFNKLKKEANKLNHEHLKLGGNDYSLTDLLGEANLKRDVAEFIWDYLQEQHIFLHEWVKETKVELEKPNNIEEIEKKNIELLKGEKSKLEKAYNENLYPFFNENAKHVFETYIKIKNDFNDLSFIYYQLTEHTPPWMISLKHKAYFDWLLKEDYINEKQQQFCYDRISLNKKTKSESRIAIYNSILNELKNN